MSIKRYGWTEASDGSGDFDLLECPNGRYCNFIDHEADKASALQPLEDRIASLEAALEKYAWHTPDCGLLTWGEGATKHCNCGFDALQGHKEREG